MNDFNIEELQIIHLDMTAYIHRTTILAESSSHKALREKIQAMINNYCEHKETEMDCDGGISLICKKCGITTLDVM